MPALPPGAEFSLSNDISYVSAPVDIEDAPVHRMALRRLDMQRATIIKSHQQDENFSSSTASSATDKGTQIIYISDSFALWLIVPNTNSLS